MEIGGKPVEFTNEELHFTINFILAGRVTTANLLKWSIWQLSQNPDVLKTMRKEQTDLSQNSKEGELTFDRVTKSIYLKAFITEVLRLHPSVPTDFKTAIKDDILPDGTKANQGESVMLVTWGKLTSKSILFNHSYTGWYSSYVLEQKCRALYVSCKMGPCG